MHYIQTLIDNRVPLKLIQIAEGESVIFCKKFKEELFDSGFFSTKEKDFVHNYITENNQKYIVTNVKFPDGRIEKNVKFRVVVSENNDVPFSVYAIKNTPKTIINENIKITEHLSIQKEKNNQSLQNAKLLEQQMLLERKKLLIEKEELEKQKKIVENEKMVANKLDSYKQQLFEEFLNASESQEKYLRNQIEEKFKNIEFKFLDEANSIKEISQKILEQFKIKSAEAIQKLVEEKIQNKYEDIKNYLLENRDLSSQLLVEKTDELKNIFNEKLILDLQQYKENLITEVQTLAEKNVEKFISENKLKFDKNIKEYFLGEKSKIEKEFDSNLKNIQTVLENTTEKIKSKEPELDEKIQLIDKKIEQLTEEKKQNSLLVSEAKTYTDKQISKAVEDSKSYAKRILDLGGGGGSVAQQFANGGTMNGSLNVYGHILSGGKNISDYFSSGGSQNTAVNSLVAGNSANWNSVYNTVKSLSDSWEESVFITEMSLASSGWNSSYSNVVANSAGWNATRTKMYASSASWDSVYSTTNTNSANWANAYTNLINNSANYVSAVDVMDDFVFNVGRFRIFGIGHSGAYSRANGAGTAGAFGNTGRFNMTINAGTAAAGNGKCGYFDPVIADMTASLGAIDYSRRIRLAINGMMYMASTNSVIRIVYGGTGNATDAPFSDQNGLTTKGFGAEFRLASLVGSASAIQARLIGHNGGVYLTPTSYTTMTSGFGISTNAQRFFGLVLESDGIGNINLYAGESSTYPNIVIPKTPLLTLAGGPTNSTSSNRFFEVHCANHSTVAPLATPSAIFQSNYWMQEVF